MFCQFDPQKGKKKKRKANWKIFASKKNKKSKFSPPEPASSLGSLLQ
jgi:hypothetical protein